MTPGTTPYGKKPSRLTDAQREYIVRRLAAGARSSQVRREVRERFGIALSPTSIDQYDPTRRPRCARRWTDLFYAVRGADAASRPEEAPASRKVERMVLRAVENLAGRILEGVLTEAAHADADEITDDDRLRAVLGFIERLKVSHHPGFMAIRRTLLEDIDAHGGQGHGPQAGA